VRGHLHDVGGVRVVAGGPGQDDRGQDKKS
jgi:hypothetical protein